MKIEFPEYAVEYSDDRPNINLGPSKKSIQIKFDNSDMISPPVGLREDIDMGREGRKYIREKIMKPFDQFESRHIHIEVPKEYVKVFRETVFDDPPMNSKEQSLGSKLFFGDEWREIMAVKSFSVYDSNLIGNEVERSGKTLYVNFRS